MKYFWVAARLIFTLFYFGVGVIGLLTSDSAKDVTKAVTPFQRALSETGFMDPLLCLACLAGGGALFFQRTAPLGIVLLAPLVIIIFFFHLVITHDWIWGTLNLGGYLHSRGTSAAASIHCGILTVHVYEPHGTT